MVKLTVLLTVIITSQISLNRADSSLLNIDVKNFLQSLQRQLEQEQERPMEEQKNNNREEEVNDPSSFDTLQKKRVEKLSGFMTKDKYSSKSINELDKELLAPSQGKGNKLKQREPDDDKERLVPNNLLGIISNANREEQGSSSEGDKADNYENPSEYSKVYVLLNSEAIKRSKNKDKLNSLLSSLMAVPAATEQRGNARGDRKKRPAYKGFSVANDLILRRGGGRDSGEIYAKEQSMDKEPLRAMRHELRSGRGYDRGGGGGGHTAIPYIRHRGDIYERDE